MNEMSITEARDALTRLPGRLARSSTSLTITKRGRPVMALMPYDLFEAILETLEIMTDEDLMKELRRGLREIERGRVVSSKKLARDLGL